MNWSKIWESFLDIIYPPNIRCNICDEKDPNMKDYGICPPCEGRLPFIVPPLCKKCGKSVLLQRETCPDCERVHHTFTKAMSILEFRPATQHLIHRYKYYGQRYLSKSMIHWMTQGLINRGWNFDAIIPVPLHVNRHRQRGFNQAILLARGLGGNLNKPVIMNSLIRIQDTPSQALLNRYQRQQNLKNAFKIKNPQNIKGKTLLLVDDVYTTGSTADYCTRVLLKAGALEVYVITLVSGVNPD